ncbi:MAG: hypothetical protein GWM90_20545, partial [Gemmatimonadetes bacterium]|nr:hypothetical protein [Gemmatimonadota bacterium]NIQ56864.1 hypothetical protein [Gemmatimonadota bacterium]NIU77221.1 hypothetical protein [Gammaproteobacteria bacterium]NIX46388.1 hypothetical protein [Gemmatimonadota bacterium]NIY10834.1 hypothetical protein [Gemmatimonadota bacterium]
ELLLPASEADSPPPGAENASPTCRPDWLFDMDVAADELKRHFNRHALDGFGFQRGDEPLIRAMGALLAYLREARAAGAEQLR